MDGATCEVTGKRCFTSLRSARRGMRRLSMRLRVYQCEHCRKWHMTSRTDGDVKFPEQRVRRR